MKYIKLFEGRRKKTGPRDGDYVIIRDRFLSEDDDLDEFLAQNIGKIDFVYGGFNSTCYRVIYKNIPEDLKGISGYPLTAYDEDIIFYAKRKQDVEDYLTAIKYNL